MNAAPGIRALGVVGGLLLAGLAMSGQAAPAAQQPVSIDMLTGSYSFEPAEVTIAPGTTVTWITRSGSHTTTSETGLWDSGERLGVGQSFTFTFEAPGEYAYYCSPHRE